MSEYHTSPRPYQLFESTVRALGDAPKGIKIRHIGICMKADPV
jgi:hypothetical protein